MAPNIAVLWKTPEVNPINGKAKSIPVFNVINIYGRVFFFSWMGFLIAFWSWYAFPPLLTKTIKGDLHLSQKEVANSNIVSLVATLVVRVIAGPLCDRFGPRKVFAGLLLAGAVPTALAGLVKNAAGLITLRFFIGVLGGTFVPCQVWSMQFFDKNIVGTSNGLIGGWGNSGGGITYFAMPAIFDSLVHARGLTPHVAWRVSFVVPFIFITTTAVLMLLLCPDTPHGAWADRHQNLNKHIQDQHYQGKVVPAGGPLSDKPSAESPLPSDVKDKPSEASDIDDAEAAQVGETVIIDEYQHEVVQNPTVSEILKVVVSPQTIVLCFAYFNSFGAELAINSILGSYYLKNFPRLQQTGSGRWAAMFGLLNVVTRPLGGIISDILYKKFKGNLWIKKMWIHSVGIIAGIFAIVIGVLDPHDIKTMIGLIAGMAIFMEAGNGCNFSLVPHVHPFANGVLSGLVGGTGNLGGVVFAIIFRYHGTDYHKVFWIIGAVTIGMNLIVAWIRPIPKGQIGGR